MMKYLSISLDDLMNVPTKLSALSELHLENNFVSDIEPIQQLISDVEETFPFSQIQKLTLAGFGDVENENNIDVTRLFNTHLFVEFISRFTNISHLQMNQIHLRYRKYNEIKIS